MKHSAVLLEYRGPLAHITLNRPAVLNAMDMAWVEGLEAAAQALAELPEIRIVVVRGAGRAFCAGLDLDMLEREGMPPGFYSTQERAFRALELMDKLVIAVLHGYCLGGGVQLAIACDIRISSSTCRIGLPAVNEGLFPGLAPYRLPRLIGLGPARRLILTGEVLDAPEALRLGLVDHLVPEEQFQSGVQQLLQTYLAGPALATVATKRLLRQAFEAPFDSVLRESEQLIEQCLASPEVQAARAAWGQRRQQRDAGRQASVP